MTAMLPRHNILLAVTAAAVLLAAVSWFFAVRPRQMTVRDGLAEVEVKRESLRRKGWPLDRTRLETLLADRQRLLEGTGEDDPGLDARAERVIQRATTLAQRHVSQRFGSDEAFVRRASNIDFREAYNAFQQRAAKANIWLGPDILNLPESASSPYTYQLLLQVWTLDRLLDLILDHRLLVQTVPGVQVTVEEHEHPAADLRLWPILAHYLSEESRHPYLLEIPVQMSVAGEVADVRAFIASLVGPSDFLPPMHVEMHAESPAAVKPGADGVITVRRVVADVVCSSFFVFPFADAQPRGTPQSRPGVVPRGERMNWTSP